MYDKNEQEQIDNISFNNLIILNRLGRGSTSHVFKTQSIKTKKYYAMKVIDKGSSQYRYQELIKQIKIHRILIHSNISQFIKHFQDNDNHYILTQYCNNGEITKLLMDFVQQRKILKILYQISLALCYMHNQVNIVHGDLKLSNILMHKSNYKLCDFGYSFVLNHGQSGKNRKGPFGTLLYMAPEILINCCSDYRKADIWAFGMCMLVMMYQGNPYQTESTITLKNKIINGQYIYPCKQNIPNYSKQLLELISTMLELDPNKRINIKQVLRHKVLDELRSSQKLQKNTNYKLQKQQNIINKQKEQPINNYQTKPKQQKQQQQQNTLNNINTQKQTNNTQLQQKQDINRSIFNLTVDTLTDSDDIFKNTQHYKYWTYCLKPQKHDTQNKGFIQIMKDHTIKIKIQKIQYLIAANAGTLQILQGYKNCRKYVGEQIKQSQKIYNLFNYALELISILKRKYCLKQQIIEGKYYWINKKVVCCLINQKTIIQKQLQTKNLYYRKIGQSQKFILQPISNDILKYVHIFQNIKI